MVDTDLTLTYKLCDFQKTWEGN